MTFITLPLFLAVCSLIYLAKSEGDARIDIQVDSGSLFIGDKAKFICSVPELDFEKDLQWEFKNKDGNSVTPVASSEDEVKGTHNGKIYRESFLTITNASSVSCIGTLKSGDTQSSSKMISVNNVSPLSAFDGSHKCMDTDGGPKIILWRYDNTGFESRFWVPHVVTNAKLELSDKVSHFRLICQFNSSVKWTLNKFNFRPYVLRSHCAEEILEVNPISAASNRDYICSDINPSTAKVSVVALSFPSSLPPPSLVKRVYDNETMDAIESVVETFDSTKAYGLGFGSSAGSIVMMIAILFLKKTLQRRRAGQQNGNAEA